MSKRWLRQLAAGLLAVSMLVWPALIAADAGAAAAPAAEAAPGAQPAGATGPKSLLEPGHNRYVPLPENISVYGDEIDHLFWLITWLTGVTFVLTEGLLVYAMLRYRHVQGAKSKYEHGNHKLEIVWTIVPGLILFGLAVYQVGSWRRIKMPSPEEEQNPVRVQVLAKQFEWNFRYPGADTKFGTDDDVYTVKKLYMPVGRRVVFELRSTDVIHSLFLPHLRFKQDVMPGLTGHGWVQATQTTKKGQDLRNNPEFNYEIVCAELCGPQHGFMRGDVYVLEAAAFDQKMADLYEEQKDFGAPGVWNKAADKQESLSWYSRTAVGKLPPPPPPHEGHGEDAHAEAAH